MGYSSKKIVPKMKKYEDNGSWMWVAFAPECRLIVAFVIGPRKQYVANELLNSRLNVFLNRDLFLSQMV